MVRQKTRPLVLLFVLAAGITSSPNLVAHDDVALCEPCERSGWNIDFELGILQWYVTRDPGTLEQENRSGTGTYADSQMLNMLLRQESHCLTLTRLVSALEGHISRSIVSPTI